LFDTDGNADWEVGVTISNAPVVADFASTGAADLGGTASKRNGGVVPNAKISCTWEGFDKKLRTDVVVVFEATANAAGEYEIEGVPFGELSCTATDPVTNAVEPFDASITGPGRVVENATFPVSSPAPDTMPNTGSDSGTLLAFALLATLLGAAFVLLRRNLADTGS
jgi:LPXTG-motif cell wall-anchored protein